MFICDACHQPTGPKVSPILVGETRDRIYNGYDEEGVFQQVGAGFETVFAHKFCPTCAGVGARKEPPSPNINIAIASYGSALVHVRKCKERLIEDCDTCKRIVGMMAQLPLPAISRCTEQPQARPFTSSLASIAVDNLLSRTNHQSKRASADFAAAYPMLKKYEQRGGGL